MNVSLPAGAAFRHASGLFLACLAAGTARADGDEYAARAHLESSLVQAGSPLTLTVRSTAVGARTFLRYSAAPGAFAFASPLLPIVHLGGPSFPLGSGLIDSSGRFAVSGTVPPGTPAGATVVVQGFLSAGSGTPWQGTNALELVVGGMPATWSDETFQLDPVTSGFSTQDVDWADLDRDGRFDVLLANDGSGGRPLVLMNEAPGGLVDDTGSRLPATALVPCSCLEAGDVNGDGWEDLFLGAGFDSAAPAPNQLLLNQGGGVFVASAGLPGGAGLALDAEFGDVDGDFDLDLVLANRQDPDHPGESPDPVTLYVNRGGAQGGTPGEFVSNLAFGQITGNGSHGNGGDVSLGDVDADGDLDLYIARSDVAAGGAQNQLYLNDGQGAFTDVTATALPAVADNSFEADFGDFDGDGLLDVFIANSISSQPNAVHLLLNQGPIGPGGTPVLADASANVPASFGPVTDVRLATDVGDVESDGDLDVVVGIHHLFGPFGNPEGRTVLLLNQGGIQGGTQGVFAVDPSFTTSTVFVASDVSLADQDNDGDLDLYVANSGDLFQADFQDLFLRNDL